MIPRTRYRIWRIGIYTKYYNDLETAIKEETTEFWGRICGPT